MAGEIPRAPLFINAPFRKGTPPDLFPNLAALVIVSGGMAHPSPEPVFYKRPAVQIDISPNLAVRSTETAMIMLSATDAQTFVRRAPIIDLTPNIAVLPAAPGYVPHALVEPSVRRASLAMDQYPNLAALAPAPPAYVPRPTVEPVLRRALTAVDLYPNLAVRGVLVYVPPAPIEPASSKRVALPSDLYPNIAAKLFVQGYVPPPFVEPTFWKPRLQIDLYPDLALTAVTTGTLTGVSGTGSVGSVVANNTVSLTGVVGTGSVGTVTPFAGTLISLTGVSATGSVGSVSLIKVLVPNVQGIPLGLAGLTLNNSALQVGSLTYQSSTAIALGSVISQSPLGGNLVFENSQVNLLISSGFVSPVNTPVSGIKVPNLPNKILPPDNQLVDGRGVIATNWWRFLLNVSNQAMGTNQTIPATVTIGASPYIFTTPAQGTLLVSGGPVTLIEYSKDGTTWYPTGVTQGQIQMVPNDHVRIAYMNAPTLTFFPR